jgi:nitrous oxidase accessory protein NosD
LANSGQVIERNCIYNCEIGLRFWGDNFVVERNRISNCSQYGIQCIASNTIITYNLLEHNAMGIYASAPTQPFTIEKNNFINNSIHTIFFVIIASPGSLQYRENYWGKQHFLPKFIFGLITSGGASEDLPGLPWLILPFIKIDWHPAKEPYDIF